jgi:hypothetical protein
MICDNTSNCHDPETIGEDSSALRVHCKNCHATIVIRKDPNTGAPEKKQYAEVFKRWILQGSDKLFYRYYPQHLKT